jgi:predicted 2-oxoglutarate/Fe(II)-dependent dioxygenase YbiX
MTAEVIEPVVRAPFPPGRTEPCFCGSGQRFKHCCVAAARSGQPPHGIVVVPEFLSAATCAELCARLDERPSERLTVVDVERSTADEVAREFDDRRVTERVDVGELQSELDELVQRAIEQRIAPRVERSFEWFEQPQLLRYRPGGLYDSHADSDNLFFDEGVWKKTLDRDMSLLIYLNDEYEGGQLEFEHFEYSLRPRAGMLVFFPSDVRYLHAARPVTAGQRYAVVSWAAFRDEPRVMHRPPERARMLGD